jgi:hypothetical protein
MQRFIPSINEQSYQTHIFFVSDQTKSD